jgi:hypothetical protein
VGRIDDDMRDRATRRASQARPDGRKAPGSSPFQKMLKLFKGAGSGGKKGGGGALKKPQTERKEETRTEARKKAAPKRPAGRRGGKSGGGPPEEDDRSMEGDEDVDDEATILEDPSIVERPVVPDGGFRYNPSLHAAIAVPKAAGEGGAALAAEIAKEIASKLAGKVSGEWRFNLRAAPVKGLSVRARMSEKRVELLVWGADAGALAQVKRLTAALQTELKALGFEAGVISTAQAG